jgi:hypothetical protein
MYAGVTVGESLTLLLFSGTSSLRFIIGDERRVILQTWRGKGYEGQGVLYSVCVYTEYICTRVVSLTYSPTLPFSRVFSNTTLYEACLFQIRLEIGLVMRLGARLRQGALSLSKALTEDPGAGEMRISPVL